MDYWLLLNNRFFQSFLFHDHIDILFHLFELLFHDEGLDHHLVNLFASQCGLGSHLDLLDLACGWRSSAIDIVHAGVATQGFELS